MGEINISNEKCCIGRGISSLKMKNGHSLEFYYQQLLYLKPKWKKYIAGSTFGAVNKGNIEDFSVFCPPLPEQRKIAAILSSIDQAIERNQAELERLQRLKRGLMQKLLTGKLRVRV